ncbi:MAG: transglycosylase SLT domain-containing protein [Spirochaetales bacterium]|jgi:membrane-bound lytic murein transglycosylase D|nr:transglycosylase SLT domain-containing protein [Spirochaetales bacterium]
MKYYLRKATVLILLLAGLHPIFSGRDIDPDDYFENTAVRRYIDRYTASDFREWLESCFGRGSFYKEYIIDRIREYDLPEALFFLPVVESGYNPKAISPSGASGMWQFMMNSIEPYDLRVDEWIDERKDFWKSTSASLKKLQYNESILGDWLLAIAAYNCGLGRMQQAITEGGSRDFWTLADGGYLPVETSRYVPKFLAIAYIGQNLADYNLPELDLPVWKWRRLPIKGQVNLQLLAAAAKIPEAILNLGNAELRYPVTPPEGYSYFLKVPDIYTDAINSTLKGDITGLNRFYVHSIRPGDTLFALARHFGVSIDLIKHHNPGIEPRYLQINSTLLVPAIREVAPFPDVSQAAAPRNSRRRSANTRYIVKHGDTLWDISRRFRIALQELTRQNGLSLLKTIHPGQILEIPVAGAGALTE